MFERIGCNSEEYTRDLGENFVISQKNLIFKILVKFKRYRRIKHDCIFRSHRKKNK